MPVNLVNNACPVITVQGDPYECGYQYGQAAADLIRPNIETYLRLFQHHAGLSPAASRQKAERFIPIIAAYNADLLAELRGVAAGAEVSLTDIMLLNARSELLSAVPLPECTTMAVLPPATSGEVWLAQNWDWIPLVAPSVLALEVAQDGKPAITMLVEAGQIGKMGMNETGLGLGINWLEVNYQRIGMPVLLLCREILNQVSIADGINAVFRALRRGTALNFLLAHADGVAVDLETTPDEFDFFEPVAGILLHTNHYLSPRFRAIDHGLLAERGGSLVRRQRAEYLLRRQPTIGREAILRVLADTANAPASIRALPNPADPELEQWTTLATILMNLSTGEVTILR